VILHRHLAISLFDFVIAGVLGYAKGFVKVFFSHGSKPSVGAKITHQLKCKAARAL
jgi:hypothetical protein